MKRGLWILLMVSCAPSGGRMPSEAGTDAALAAFQAGDFDKAESLARGGTDPETRLLLARLHLLRNRPKEAVEILHPLAAPYRPFTQAMPAKYDDVQLFGRVLGDLAPAYVRSDDFFNAGRVFAALGENILASKYTDLAQSVAYLTTAGWTESSIELVGTDPLPHVAMSVNGRVGIFLIDTTSEEIVIDREFAKRAGLIGRGLRTTNYNVSYDEATVEELSLGRLTVKNIPVHLGRLTPIARMRAEGAIGLAFLMHFDFTLDYRRSRLILRRAGGSIPGGVPAVWAGDRYLLAQGSVNGRPGSWIAINTAMPDVVVAASEGVERTLNGPVREISLGALRLVQPPLDLTSFPTGLDGAFGFPAGLMLAHNGLRDRSLRLEPRSMKLLIE
jgi:aspartyl protease